MKNANRQHLTVEEYKEVDITQQKIGDINAQINELKKKSERAKLKKEKFTAAPIFPPSPILAEKRIA